MWLFIECSSNFLFLGVIITFTFLNCSRLHVIIPKHPISTVWFKWIKAVGSVRCNFIGNKYQFNWSNCSALSSYMFVSCCPISQQKNNIPSGKNPCKIIFASSGRSLVSFDCKPKRSNRFTQMISNNWYSCMQINLLNSKFHLNHHH